MPGNYARDAARRHQRAEEEATAAREERMAKAVEEQRERLRAQPDPKACP